MIHVHVAEKLLARTFIGKRYLLFQQQQNLDFEEILIHVLNLLYFFY